MYPGVSDGLHQRSRIAAIPGRGARRAVQKPAYARLIPLGGLRATPRPSRRSSRERTDVLTPSCHLRTLSAGTAPIADGNASQR